MIFRGTGLAGAYLIELEPQRDERGLFARTWSLEAFAERGLATSFSQCATSFNLAPGTLRGLHYQVQPLPEAKLVRCTRGRIFDVAVDIRPKSPTYGKWAGVELSDEGNRMFWVPAGFAHGFCALSDEADVAYKVTGYWSKEVDGGVRWDDPRIGVRWPVDRAAAIVSAKDAALPTL